MLKEIQESAKNYSVLYVEDDDKTRVSMEEILKLLFGHVYVAQNGQEGFEVFENAKPDLIISDVSMPFMSGIEMAQKIRTTNQNIPIILFTAFSDKEYLLESINLGIDRYINKPLDKEIFFGSLNVILKKLDNDRLAKKYQEEKIQNKINEAALEALKKSTQIYPIPTFIFKNESLYFINESAVQLCEFESIEDTTLPCDILEKKIVKKDGYLDSFSSLDSLKEKNKILWQFKSGRQKIFLISKKEIDDLQIFSLSDITRMEYDKQRNRYLLDYLFDILQRMRKRAIVYDKGEVKVEKLEEKSFVEPTYDQIRLDAMHGYERENALDYVNSLDETIFEEIAEMEELENDISLVVDEIEEHFSLDKINQYGLLLQKYSKIISSLIEFEDLAYSLAKISNFLETLHHRDFDERKLFIILLSIKEDLKYWRKNIFETKEAKDIHYLDASLLSSCLQIENEFINKSFQDDDTNDLELF